MALARGKGVSILLRILIAFLLVNLTTSVVIIVAAYGFSSKSIERRAKESISQQVAVMRDRFEKEFRINLDRSLRWLTSASHIDDYLFESASERLVTTKKIEHLFRTTVKDFRSYRSVSFADAEGRIAVVSPRRNSVLAGATLTGYESAESSPVIDAMSTLFEEFASTPLLLSSGNMEWFMPPREMRVSAPFVDLETGATLLVAGLAKLDLDTGTFGGVTFITLSLDDFLEYLGRVQFFDANPIWVLGPDGRVLQKPTDQALSFDPRPMLPPEFSSTLVLKRGAEGMVAYQDFTIVTGQPHLRIAVSVPSSLLVKDLGPAVSFFSLVLLVSIAVVLMVSLYVSRYLSKPIVQLAAAAAKLAKGDLNTTVAVRTTGEVQTLVSSFNKMTLELRETMAARDASVTSLTSEVSERKRAEEELKRHAAELSKATAAAEAADRAKSDFLATMSHEIRTPINGVLGMIALLLNTDLNPRQNRLGRSVQRSGQALLNIITDVLDFSKIEAGRIEIEHEPFNLRILVEDVIDMFAESAHGKGVELAGVLDANAHTAFIGDPGRVRQVLTNLVGNAVKFTEQGEVVVAVTAIKRESDLGYLTVEVRDTGIGIPDTAQARIFDAFMQADGSTTRRFGGTGLGLSICKQLVELMSGSISVVSLPGKGSTFTFTVALTWDEADTPKMAPTELGGLKILVVDDNAICRRIMVSQLASWNAECHCANNGPSAFEDLQIAADTGYPFDIVFTDMHMPGMTGLDISEQIKAEPALADTAVVLLSSVDEDFADERRQAGIEAHLTKPVRQHELRSTLRSLLSGESGDSTTANAERNCRGQCLRGHILIADDNAVNREMALGMVELLGCTARTAADGRAAVLAYQGQRFDAILMDCQMPGLDGYEATMQIRRCEAEALAGKRLPIIALTANVFKGQRQKCLDADMDDYLAKPFELEDLRTKLRQWLPALEEESLAEPGSVPRQQDSEQISDGQVAAARVRLDPKAIANLRALQKNGEQSVIVKFSRVFEQTSNDLMRRLRLGMQQVDADEVSAAAHSLKTCSANLGASDLAALAKQLEVLARVRDLAGAQSMFTQLEHAYGDARAALDVLCECEEVA